jgi:nitroreductase
VQTYEAIMTRRSTPRTEGPAPDRATILKLLDAAVRAPNHHLTEPWRFVVLAGAAREALGEVWAEDAESRGKDAASARTKPLRAPAIITVIETPKSHLPKIHEVEEHHATGAAMQNILLAAHDMGLGAMLRTGPPIHIPKVHELLALRDGEFIAGMIYLGHKPAGDDDRPRSRRTEASEITTFMGEDR